jgi:HK97 family phage major capsid protein
VTRIRLVSDDVTADVTADKATRRISGRLLPFGVVATPSVGPRVEFAADGIHVPTDDVWLNREHADSDVLGRAINIDIRPDGIHAAFSILPTRVGDDALVEASTGARAGLSIEAEIIESEDMGDHLMVTRSVIHGAALVRRPAFPDAGVYDVAATAATNTMEEGRSEVENTAAVVEATAPVEVAAAAPVALPSLGITTRPRNLPTLESYILAAGRGDHQLINEYNAIIKAADPDTLLADVAGLIPKAIVGPVISLRDGMSPLFNALGPSVSPTGSSFTIPKVTTGLAAAAGGTELSDVTGPIDVAGVNVANVFIKRAVSISYEAIQNSNPAVVSVAQGELATAIGLGQEEVVAGVIEGATGTNTGVAPKADGSDAWSVLSAAVAAQYTASGKRPDVFACPPDIWAALAGMTNSLGQPLVQGISQDLTGSWGTLFGIPIVVTPALTAAEGFLLSSYGVRSWAQSEIQLQLSQPTTFAYELGAGRTVACSVADGKFITPVTITATP